MDIGKGVLERASLALVDLVYEDMAGLACARFVEPVFVFLIAAVVHDDDVVKTCLEQPVCHRLEAVIGVERRQNDGNTLKA